jgi:hypothetical protein
MRFGPLGPYGSLGGPLLPPGRRKLARARTPRTTKTWGCGLGSYDTLIDQANSASTDIQRVTNQQAQAISELEQILLAQGKQLEQIRQDMGQTFAAVQAAVEGISGKVTAITSSVDRDVQQLNKQVDANCATATQECGQLAAPLKKMRESVEAALSALTKKTSEYDAKLEEFNRHNAELEKAVTASLEAAKASAQAFKQTSVDIKKNFQDRRTKAVEEYAKLHNQVKQSSKQVHDGLQKLSTETTKSSKKVDASLKETGVDVLKKSATHMGVDTPKEVQTSSMGATEGMDFLDKGAMAKVKDAVSKVDSTIGKAAEFCDKAEAIIEVYKQAKNLGLI